MEPLNVKRNLGPNLHFDPRELGNMELSCWRADDDADQRSAEALHAQLDSVLYGLTPEESRDAQQCLTRGMQSRDDKDWGQAFKEVTLYYAWINQTTGERFDPREAAGYEVAGWKIRDRLELNPNKTELIDMFTKLYAVIYGLPEEELQTACESKAQAVYAHELAEDPNTRDEEAQERWGEVARSLVSFYAELKDACLY